MNARRNSAPTEEQTQPTPPAMGAGADAKRDATTAVPGILEGPEPDQLSEVTHPLHVGRRALRPGMLVLFWALRTYVVVMLILVAHQIWIALHW